jgi:AraC-like DNA-binding protein
MHVMDRQNSTGTPNVPKCDDAEECRAVAASLPQVAWPSVASSQPPPDHRALENVICRLPDHEPAERQAIAEMPLLTMARQYIEDHCSENLLLEHVADALGADRFHLGRLVKQATAMDFSDYLASVRVEKARNLLLNPNYYFIELASELGFESLGQFNQAFTRIVGEPPHAYRARLPAMLRCVAQAD